jgi:hypothetical protein
MRSLAALELFVLFALIGCRDGAIMIECTSSTDCADGRECLNSECVLIEEPPVLLDGGRHEGDAVIAEPPDAGSLEPVLDAGMTIEEDAGEMVTAGCPNTPCPEDQVCDRNTGRCFAVRCTEDQQCGPPDRVCSAGQCVFGCGRPGGLVCSGSTICDAPSGRCIANAPCSGDPQCGAPDLVCEANACVLGCARTGAPACPADTSCNELTGRCRPGGPSCRGDIDCTPPASICLPASSTCEAGCLATGCALPEICDEMTGHCFDPLNPAGMPLGSSCAGHADCASLDCFDFGIGPRCVKSCGTSADCDATSICQVHNGAKMCVPIALTPGGSFANPIGAACSSSNECHSNHCDDGQCVELCDRNADCGGGVCSISVPTPEDVFGSCAGPIGATPPGQSCNVGMECQSGVCFNFVCTSLCATTPDCPSGQVCFPYYFSTCIIPTEIGFCTDWYPRRLKLCIDSWQQPPLGAEPCATSSDCPSGQRCRVTALNILTGGDVEYSNLCVPAP